VVRIGDGWVPIVDRLVTDLEAMGWRGRVDQVKENFGGLRFYYPADPSIPARPPGSTGTRAGWTGRSFGRWADGAFDRPSPTWRSPSGG
jgi:hypothetical protein